MAETERPVIDGLVGVYDARGSLRGELAYADLELCAGDVDCFADALRRSVDDHHLSLSARAHSVATEG